MQCEAFTGRRQPSVRMVHFLKGVKTLCVEVYDVKSDLQPVFFLYLAQVADVKLSRIGRVPTSCPVIGTKAQSAIGLVSSQIEQNRIVTHVEMAVIVDPVGADREG